MDLVLGTTILVWSHEAVVDKPSCRPRINVWHCALLQVVHSEMASHSISANDEFAGLADIQKMSCMDLFCLWWCHLR